MAFLRILKSLSLPVACAQLLLLSACMTTNGEQYRANVYKASEVNKAQDVKTVKILAVLPAKIEVSNENAKFNAQLLGGLLGAAAGGAIGANQDEATVGVLAGAGTGAILGSMVSDTKLVDGVSLTYVYEGKTKNSAQVGRTCEFAPGLAVVISRSENETRIQANAQCPEKG